MAKRRKKRKKKPLTQKERRNRMLSGSEWVLLGVFFVALSEGIVRYYGLSWRYMPYAFAVWMVLIFRMFLVMLRFVTKGANFILNSISDLNYKR
jgi:hypothetical protein